MNITIKKNENKICTYTDKIGGYVELRCTGDADFQKSGYYRGDARYLSGIGPWSPRALCGAIDAIDVQPNGCCLKTKGATLDVSLLIGEGAFWVRSNSGVFEAFGLYPVVEQKEIDSNFAEPGGEVRKDDEQEAIPKEEELPKEEPVWTFATIDGVSVISIKFDNHAVAISGVSRYEVITQYGNAEGGNNAGESPKVRFFSDVSYIAFEDSEDEARQKVVRLAKSNAKEQHDNKVAEFLQRIDVAFEYQNQVVEDFDDSVKWAAFHAWMLSVWDKSNNHWGLWAGLPWFRENWGRDTFISLCGTLLVAGEFQEARSVLTGFIEHQDTRLGSETYGRIPNRYRCEGDAIYNTVDGTLWFIRALKEYMQYSGDTAILNEVGKCGSTWEVVKRAIDADITRCDSNGFLCHGEADTWMDARRKGLEALSPRGDRACEVQALWWTALQIASEWAKERNDQDASNRYDAAATKVKSSFLRYFWRPDYDMVSDHLLPGGYGEWAPDLRVRPNQVFVITVPRIADGTLGDEINKTIMKNVDRELLTPFGLTTLSPFDPLFHVHHETCELYHKDAAYHNGTIWPWNSGAYISAQKSIYGGLQQEGVNILHNESLLIMRGVTTGNSAAGSLSENIHAASDANANPILSGTFSQCWSLAEYVRNIYQDALGWIPQMDKNRVLFFPAVVGNALKARVPFVDGSSVAIDVQVGDDACNCTFLWSGGNLQGRAIDIVLQGGGKHQVAKLTWQNELRVTVDKTQSVPLAKRHKTWAGTQQSLTRKNKIGAERFSGSEHIKDYLFNLVKGGRMHSMCCAGENTAALEWLFDSKEFDDEFALPPVSAGGVQLGATCNGGTTTFRIWAPTSTAVQLLIQKSGGTLRKIEMSNEDRGVWSTTVAGNKHGATYEYAFITHGVYNHTIDPYAVSCTIDGRKGVVIDWAKTNPAGWENVHAPTIQSPNDAVICELHVQDVTSSATWNGNPQNRKRFSGVVEGGTKYNDMATGWDYIKSLGVTHIQLLPIFDYASVDDAGDRLTQFNWGYDPRNYGCVKGIYSSNPGDPVARIRELKELVQKASEAGIGVIMDVVFNHVTSGLHQALGVSVPGYFFRVEGYSGAGEDTASEHVMMRRYMIDMLKMWLEEYKLCGFRFDLMGLHDVITMNEIYDELHKIKPDVLVYGEGWDMYRAGKMEASSMCNASKMPHIGHFNDAVRCSIKGPCNDDRAPGYIHTGKYRETIKSGIVGMTRHPQVDNTKVELTSNKGPWSSTSSISMNYTEIHDNMTMNDKLRLVEEGRTESYYEQLGKMAISLVMVMQGVPVMQLGQESLRTKRIPVELLDHRGEFCSDVAMAADQMTFYVRNSYNAPDGINSIDWARVYEHRGLAEYVKLVIKMRREHTAFRIVNQDMIAKAVRFIDNEECHFPKEIVAWVIDGAAVGDKWRSVLVIANPLNEPVGYTLPLRNVFTTGEQSLWRVATDGVNFCPPDCVVHEAEGSQFVLLGSKTVSVFYTV